VKVKFTILFFIILAIVSKLGASDKILNINNIIENASKNNKQVMVFFHMTHCGYCKRMKNRTLTNSKVKSYMDKHFILIDINIDDNKIVLYNTEKYTKKDFANYLDVDFYPTVLFFDENLEITYTSKGYRKISKFQQILEFIHTKAFEKVDFFDYYKGK